MDWQEPVALGIVALTAWLMGSQHFRSGRRRPRARGGCGCGCPAGSNSPSERILYRARKGQRAAWIVRPG